MENTIRKILVDVCDSEDVLNPDIDLIESGLLDSLAIINLFTELDDLGIEIQPTQFEKNDFRTIEGILKIVKQHYNKTI